MPDAIASKPFGGNLFPSISTYLLLHLYFTILGSLAAFRISSLETCEMLLIEVCLSGGGGMDGKIPNSQSKHLTPNSINDARSLMSYRLNMVSSSGLG